MTTATINEQVAAQKKNVENIRILMNWNNKTPSILRVLQDDLNRESQRLAGLVEKQNQTLH